MIWPRAEVAVGAGWLCFGPLPHGAAELADLAAWQPDHLISLTEEAEMADLARPLAAVAGQWHFCPTPDFGVPLIGDKLLSQLVAQLRQGARVAIHCKGGCGRSGAVALRLLVLSGIAPEAALAQLRALQPCAVETEGQMIWASA